MARIAGVDLPKNKRMEIALTYIFGIGRSMSRKVLQEVEIQFDTKSDDLSDDDVVKIRRVIDQGLKVEGDNRREGVCWSWDWQEASRRASDPKLW